MLNKLLFRITLIDIKTFVKTHLTFLIPIVLGQVKSSERKFVWNGKGGGRGGYN